MAHSHFVVSNPRHTFATPLRYSSTDNAVVGTRCRYSSTTRSSVLLNNAVVGTPRCLEMIVDRSGYVEVPHLDATFEGTSVTFFKE